MQPRRDQFLAGTAFADDQDRFRQRGSPRYMLEHLEKGRGFTDDRLGFGTDGHWRI